MARLLSTAARAALRAFFECYPWRLLLVTGFDRRPLPPNGAPIS
jgi:hypothetical protein